MSSPISLNRAGREKYGDSAIGYVQLRRDGDWCQVSARVTPEHKVTSKPYRVTAFIDEKSEVVEKIECLDCVACKGGCKHGVALLMWLNRRTAEPSVTEVEAYWRKARLSLIGSSVKSVPSSSLRHAARASDVPADIGESFFAEMIDAARNEPTCSGILFDYHSAKSACEAMAIDKLLQSFRTNGGDKGDVSAADFIRMCGDKMTEAMCREVEILTKDQSASPMWHAMRFGRITASKVTEAAHCRTPGGSLVMTLLGAAKLRDNAALKRGRELEPLVLKQVGKKLKTKVDHSGLVIRPQLPIFGASPDGLTSDGKAVVEVKCPTDRKNMKRYMRDDGTMMPKHRGQVQLQMHMTGRRVAFFCVADPSFTDTKHVHVCKERYDEAFCRGLVQGATKFWCDNVYPELTSPQ